MAKKLESLEKRLYEAELENLAAALNKAADEFAKAFEPYVGYAVGNVREQDAQMTEYTNQLGGAFAHAIALRFVYNAGHVMSIQRVDFRAIIDKYLPSEVKAAITTYAVAAFVAKVESSVTIASENAEILASIER